MSIRRNTLLGLAGQGASLAISLVTVPIFLRLIGEDRYGVMLVVWLLLGYFGLFDLGVSTATGQRIATLKQASPEERNAVLWTSLALNALIGVFAAAILYGAGHAVLAYVVITHEAVRDESIRALPWIALSLPISMAASTLSAALTGRERFLSSNAIQTLGTLLAQTLPLFVAWRLTTSLDRLIEAALLARVISVLVLFATCRTRVPLTWPPRVDRSTGRSLLSFGGWLTVSGIVGPLMTSLDRLLISAIAGTSALTYYSVPQGLCARLGLVANSFAGALSPRFASAEPAVREALAERAVRALACITTPVTLLGLALIEPFLAAWISRDFAVNAAASGQILLVGIWANGLAMIAHANLIAQGRPSVVARAHLLELPVYLAVLAAALHLLGIVGASAAWSGRTIADAALLFTGCGSLRAVVSRLRSPICLIVVALAVCLCNPLSEGLRLPILGLLLLLSLLWARHNVPAELSSFRAIVG